ncbi:MAG: twin-arginine translocation signal domain-containing protein, partial [Verrucomicrobiota bacterium]|nr:twin-arginine translocation signal domain-containing protein [Verrucomicrobiota bacterium]
MPTNVLNRRDFLTATAAAGTLAAMPAWAADKAQKRLRLGLDNFAVRAMGWKAKELVDYAAVLRCDSLFITDLGPFESFTDRYLKGVKQHADDKGIKLYIGSWSICPTSPSFKKDWGTAAEHLALGVRVSKIMGSPAFRVILGSRKDRLTEGGIDARIDDTV